MDLFLSNLKVAEGSTTNEISVQVDTERLMKDAKESEPRVYVRHSRKETTRNSCRQHCKSYSNPSNPVYNSAHIYDAKNYFNPIIENPSIKSYAELNHYYPEHKRRSRSNEQCKHHKSFSNRLLIHERIKSIIISSRVLPPASIKKSTNNNGSVIIPVSDLSSKLLPKISLIKIPKIKEYKRYSHTPLQKQKKIDCGKYRRPIIDLTVRNSKINKDTG